MWFNDGEFYDAEYHNKTYRFDGAKLKIRNG